jgi:hypothetical protein
MNAVIGAILAVLAIFILIKVTLWIFKVIAVLILVGALIFGYFWLKNRMDGGRQ